MNMPTDKNYNFAISFEKIDADFQHFVSNCCYFRESIQV